MVFAFGLTLVMAGLVTQITVSIVGLIIFIRAGCGLGRTTSSRMKRMRWCRCVRTLCVHHPYAPAAAASST